MFFTTAINEKKNGIKDVDIEHLMKLMMYGDDRRTKDKGPGFL
jgi:hypothetical protein